ncbi:MAG: DUF748 domain-containing protein [Geobacter sp.]|nr:DUF748 domain-containing protein [Geobacter sp.]
MNSRRKLLIIIAAILAALFLFTTLILPGIVRNKVIRSLETATSRKAELAGISLNPFTLSAKLRGFRLCERDRSTTFASFSSARIAVSPASIFRQALVVSSVTVRAPYLHLERTAPNSYNFSELLVRKEPPKPDAKPFLFSINNIEIDRGSVDFMDRAVATPTAHTVRNLELAVPFVSNVPYLADRYVAPRISAKVNGTELSASGKLKPLSSAIEASLHLSLQGIDLPHYLAYLPKEVPLRIASGELTTSLDLAYRVSAANKPDLTLKGDLALDKLSVTEKSGAPLFNLGRGAIRINEAALFARSFDLARLTVVDPEIFLDRAANGKWNLQRLTPEQPAAQSVSPKKEESAEKGIPAAKEKTVKPRINLAALQITGGRFHFADRLPASGFRTDLEGIDLNVRGFSTDAGRRATWTAALKSSRGESLNGSGELTMEPLAVTARVTLEKIMLAPAYPYLAAYLASPVSGTVDASTTLAYSPAGGLTLSDLTLTGHALAARFGDKDGINLQTLTVSGANLDLAKRTAGVELVEIAGGSCRVSRMPDGTISAARIVVPAKPKAAAPPSSPAQPFSYRIAKVATSGLTLGFRDLTRSDPPEFTLSRVAFAVSEITGPRTAAMPFSLQAVYGKNGTVKSMGTVTPQPFKLKGKMDIRRIPLRDFEAYLPDDLNLFVADGSLDSRMTISLAKGSSGMTGTFAGNLGIRSFYCLDTVENEDLLKWESLQLDEVSGAISPFTLSIRQVALSNPYARVVINKDGSLNLQNLKGTKEAAATVQPGATPAVAQAAPAPALAAVPAPAPRKIKVDTITVQDGTLSFDDRHLPTTFATTFFNLGGRVTGMSSDERQQADVDLRGNLENHSPLRITGTLNPLWSEPFVDLKVSFTDIELSPFTPYSGTYLGYTVDKGKLFLDLKYRIEKKTLNSENRLFFDQFTLGERVESEKATSLPVRLALALLKDRKGEIHLDLPVTGRTDDPKFSVWGVVLQMLKNLLVKAATSPFSLLASAFGSGDDFSVVTFPPGSARLETTEQEKLAKLAKALEDRPALKLEISGFVDRERDSEGYRQEQLLRKLKTEKFLTLSKARKNQPGQTPDNVEVLPAEQSALLKAVYAKEKFPKPRTALGFVKSLPDAEMRKLILTNTPVGDAQLQALAREREEAVRSFLLQQKLPATRLFQKSADIYKPAEKEGVSNSRVEFGAGAS